MGAAWLRAAGMAVRETARKIYKDYPAILKTLGL